MSGPREDAAMPKPSVSPDRPPAHEDVPRQKIPPRQLNQPEPHSSGLTIIGSKIGAAAPARAILARPRLVDWFEQHARARLIVVSAEAGYGKTTLLGEFASQSRDRVVWYRLERSDGDWITFLSYLVAALRDIWHDFGRPTEALLRNVAAMGSTQEVVLSQFLADLSSAEARRIAVILDDYHLVDQAPDVRMIVSRMLERAPEGMYFILSGRGVPTLSVGRLRGQGRVYALNIDDLRFTLAEIEELFANTYGQPLDDHTCRIIAERTEGWAAGLQLVAASIAVSQPDEVSDFITALSGATGPIYDFLAEEVLTRLSAETQRVLMHASLPERVEPEYVSAALDAGGTPVDRAGIEASLDRADSLGLLGVRSKASRGRRMQALFREFLAVNLGREVPAETLARMHLAIAEAAESDDWLMAAHHYARADHHEDAMRVIGSAAGEALGTGAWGAAVEVVDTMPETEAPPAVKVIQARALISDDDIDAAITTLSTIDRATLNPEERGLVGLTWATLHHGLGEGHELHAVVDDVAGDEDIPAFLRDICASWKLILAAAAGGSITAASSAMRRLAAEQVEAGLHYFAGVTLHNASTAELALGNYRQAVELARASVSHITRTSEAESIVSSTRVVEAAALAEMGEIEEGLRLSGSVAAAPSANADAIAEAAYLHAVCGREQRARTLLSRFDRGEARWARDPSSQAVGWYARFALAMNMGAPEHARHAVSALESLDSFDLDSASRRTVMAATVAVACKDPLSSELVGIAADVIERQHAWRWSARVHILQAVVARDGEGLALWMSQAEAESSLAVLELADAVATAVGTLAPVPESLERSILREPRRWISALSRQVQDGPSDNAGAAAALIARYGTAEDATVLRDFEKAGSGKPRKRGLTTQLIRRVSPAVRVHDLGLASYEIGDRGVKLTETRRKTAALLLFLVTRSDLAANREQVMEALWPDQTPKSALNSLHQTIFFLRRELEPWYEDGASADYVHMDAELVRLDLDLFQVDSVAFARQSADIIGTGTAGSRGPEMLALYRGHFAPEFEYEEWADTWRTHLHTNFLHLAQATSRALVVEHRFGEVVEILTAVVALDPVAFDLRGTLIGCLAAAGAKDASLAHYRSMAAAHERELGLPAPSYADLVRDTSAMP